jgi:hypothetical protein
MRRILFFLLAGAASLAIGIGACAKLAAIDVSDGDSGTMNNAGCADADVSTDPANCGACGHACTKGQVCASGTCKAECDPPTIKCNGTCVDIKSDPSNCGGCGKTCMFPDAGGIPPGNGNSPDAGVTPADAGTPWDLGMLACTNAVCGIQCTSGKQNCGGVCFDTSQMHDHCGDCNTACADDEWCTMGKCCKFGETNCNGTCVNLNTDPMNCGKCGFACAMQTPNCNAGTCTQGLSIVVEGHANVIVNCQKGDYSCQAHEVCNKVTGYNCVFQQYDCAYGNMGSWYPPDGMSGGAQFNFAYAYDFYNNTYGNICACNQSQMQKYGLAAKYQYCGLGHWQRQ